MSYEQPALRANAPVDDHAYRMMVESIGDYAIFMLTPTGHIASWNQGAENIKGYHREEILGKHFSVFYPEEMIRKGWPEHELRVAASESRFEDEGWRLRKDGSLFWASVVIAALRDEKGGLRGFSKVTRDLSHRRLQEERLRESEERLRLLIDSVVDYAIFMLDPDGRIMSWNPGAERIKGYSAQEIIGQSFTRFYTQEALATDHPMELLDQARRAGSAREEGWRVRKDGSLFMADVLLTALHDEAGTLRGFAKITRDLTQSKRIETLETEGRRINEFLAMLAHELRNPLAPIRNAVSMMRMRDLPREQWTICRDLIDRQSQHLTRLVDDLLDVSRITSGKITLSLETLDLVAVLARTAEASTALMQARGLEFTVDIGTERIAVVGDATRLMQVVTNLLNNAAKYTLPGGAVTLSATTEGHSAVVRVQDTGIGIAPELIDKIFDIFQQGNRTLDRQEGGLGIGLSLVRSIMHMHGGTAVAISAGEGRGAELVLTLPLAEEAGLDVEREQLQTETAGRSLRVLIVDDNKDNAASMAALMSVLSHIPEVLHEGGSVIEVARRFRPELILLDIGLPVRNGYDVARDIRACPDLAHVKLSAMTGYGQIEDRQRAAAAGFDAFMIKPVDLEELKALLARSAAELVPT